MSDAPVEVAGLGFSMEIPEGIPAEKVWQTLLTKITQPELFLPVTDVSTRPSDDGLGTYGEMSMGPHRVISNAYADEPAQAVTYVDIADNTEIVNVINTDADGMKHMEFYKRNSTTKERIHWGVPVSNAVLVFTKVFEHARTL